MASKAFTQGQGEGRRQGQDEGVYQDHVASTAAHRLRQLPW